MKNTTKTATVLFTAMLVISAFGGCGNSADMTTAAATTTTKAEVKDNTQSTTAATTAAKTSFSLEDVQGEWSVMTIDGVDAYDYAMEKGYPTFEYPVQENFTITSDSMVSEYYMDGCLYAVDYKITAIPNGFSAKHVNGSGTTDFKYDKNTDTLSYEFTSIHGLQEKRVLKHSSTDIMGEFAKQYSISYNTTYGKMLYDVQRTYRYDDVNCYFVSEIYAVSSTDKNADYSTITSELNELQIYIADNGDLVGEGYAFTFDQRHIGCYIATAVYYRSV